MSRNRKTQRENEKKKLEFTMLRTGYSVEEFHSVFGTNNMTYDEIVEFWENLPKSEKALHTPGGNGGQSLGTKNASGHTDLTPYNAITGKDLMSVGRVTDPAQKLPGGFNTKKG